MTTKDLTEAPERLYAHWLDGEWNRIAFPITLEGPYRTLQGMAEGALKLHALFGTRFAISDIQLTDSPVLIGLFGDSEFRSYLKSDEAFLTLIAEPRPDVSDPRLARATRGIERACKPGWTTSLRGISVDVIQQFAAPLLSATTVDTARWLTDRSSGPGRIISQFPEHDEVLRGILHGICHFAKMTGGPSEAPPRQPRAYTDFIDDAINGNGLESDTLGALEAVRDSIQSWVPEPGARRARSSLIKKLEAQQPDRNRWPPEWHRDWNTVVHAWNASVCDTLGAKGASIAPLPGAVITYRGSISDIVGPFRQSDGILQYRPSRKYPLFAFDPHDLDWLTVRDAVRAARSQRTAFQRALWYRSPEETEEASLLLIERLATKIPFHARTAFPWWVRIPVAAWALLHHIPGVKEVVLFDEAQAHLRTEINRRAVLNTLHGFKDDLIRGVRSA